MVALGQWRQEHCLKSHESDTIRPCLKTESTYKGHWALKDKFLVANLFDWFGLVFLNLSVDYSQPLESLLEGSGQHLLYKGKVNRENHNQSGLGPSRTLCTFLWPQS